MKVKLGNNKQIEVEGKGIIVVNTSQGKEKFLHNVFFIFSLAHNLLSVRQIMATRYSILFDDDSYAIKDKESR